MCTTCGCGGTETHINGQAMHEHVGQDGRVYRHVHAHPHDHDHDYLHDHGHPHSGIGAVHSHAGRVTQSRMVRIEQDILAKNNAHAGKNREFFKERGILALNLVSSPGSGKTALLVRTIAALDGQPVAVIEGDQQTSNDAERIRASGAPAIQINTGKGCHLDAQMVEQALPQLAPVHNSLLFIENVGNLVCPAAFDLGEAAKVAILSVTEGEDKPLKYPDMFRAARLMLLNKCDLLPYLQFNVEQTIENAHRVNPAIEVIQISVASGAGMQDWLAWLQREQEAMAASQGRPVTA